MYPELATVCVTVLCAYALHLYAIHEQGKALKLAHDTADDLVDEAAKIAARCEDAAVTAGKHKDTTNIVLLEHNTRLHAAELKLSKLVMR